MDKVITTALLIIAGVVVTVMLYNVVYPAVIQSGEALTSRQRRIDERLDSQIEVIHANGSTSDSDVSVWVKNIGSLRIDSVERCDVFFGLENNFSRIPYGSDKGPPYWEYELEGDNSEWEPSVTLKITIRHGGTYPSAGKNFVKIVLPNGVSNEYYFSIE